MKVLPLQRPGAASDGALVLQARDGNTDAQAALFRRHVRRIMGLAYRLAPEEEPEDVAQDAFLKAFGSLDTLTTPSAFGGWLTAITVSLIRMRLRKRRWLRRLGLLRGQDVDPDSLVSGDAPEEVRLRVRDLYRAVQTLPEEERMALLLQRVEGLELGEIAAQMTLSIATVKRRIVAAEHALAEVTHDDP